MTSQLLDIHHHGATAPLLDIHHHGATAPSNAVTSFTLGEPMPAGDGLLSAGIHPWSTETFNDNALADLEHLITGNTRIVAIGETGLDMLRGASVERQMEIFRAHIELSEQLRMPLVIHSVHATDRLLQLHKLMHPSQHWVIHGFRSKPAEAQQLVRHGIYLSFGARFNPDALAAVPPQFILAETDESPLTIDEIIRRLAPVADSDLIAANTAAFLAPV
ncbi:MAG: TatD family hydrolase [Muribaculaceae bacterium]|nr:TatD family hydrolase [Muribaculaceae bacterium]